MCNSLIKVINFDKMPQEYCKLKGISVLPSSNDALYTGTDDSWVFIEFKNGSIEKENIFRKIYDSLIILLEMNIIPSFDFARKQISYILVYNSDKYPLVQNSVSRQKNYSYFLERADAEAKLFGLEKLEGYLLNEVHTYDKHTFKSKFINVMELQEG